MSEGVNIDYIERKIKEVELRSKQFLNEADQKRIYEVYEMKKEIKDRESKL